MGIVNAHIPFPTWHREVGSGTQTRIPVFKISYSALVLGRRELEPAEYLEHENAPSRGNLFQDFEGQLAENVYTVWFLLNISLSQLLASTRESVAFLDQNLSECHLVLCLKRRVNGPCQKQFNQNVMV